MSIESKIESMLVNHGLWPNEAKIIVSEVKKDLETMQGRWEEDETAYPTELLSVIWVSTEQKALQWIDTNKPKHFARFLLAHD